MQRLASFSPVKKKSVTYVDETLPATIPEPVYVYCIVVGILASFETCTGVKTLFAFAKLFTLLERAVSK